MWRNLSRLRPFTGLISVGLTTLDPGTPSKLPQLKEDPVTKSSRIAYQQDPKYVAPKLKKFPLGVSTRAQQIWKEVESNPGQFNHLAVMVLDLSKIEIQSSPEMRQLLKSTIVLSSPESLSDLLVKILEEGHKEQEKETEDESGKKETTTTTTSPETKTTVVSYANVLKLESKPRIEPTTPIVRPADQQQDLACWNCGSGTGSFNTFCSKHVITNPFEPNTASYLVFLRVMQTRIHEAYSTFSYFFVPNPDQMKFEFDDYSGICYSLDKYPCFTARRYKRNDNISIITFNGECAPTYLKSNGHLVSPLQCQVMQGPQGQDYAVTLRKMEEIQERFAEDYLRAPPKQFDWDMASFRQRRLDARLNRREFHEEAPEKMLTKREKVLEDYRAALKNLEIEKIPKEVYQMFFYKPRYFYTGVRDGHVRSGVVAIGNLLVGTNPHPEYPKPDLIPPPPTQTEFPSLSSADQENEEQHQEPIEDGQIDTRVEDNEATTTTALNTIFNMQRRFDRDRT